MQILETLYYEWNNNSGRSRESDPIVKEMDRIIDAAKKGGAMTTNHFYKLDDLIGEYGAISEKEGFMAGFEMCKQLLLGGKLQ